MNGSEKIPMNGMPRAGRRSGHMDSDEEREGYELGEGKKRVKSRKRTSKIPYGTLRANRGEMVQQWSPEDDVPAAAAAAAADDEAAAARRTVCAVIRDIIPFAKPAAWTRFAQTRQLRIEDEEGHLADFPKHVWQLRNLESLTLTLSRTHALTKASSHGLLQLRRLRVLGLPENGLKVADGVQAVRGLVELDLSRNLLVALPRDLGHLQRLRKLCVSGNRLAQLPDSLGQLRELQHLDANANCLQKLPDTIGALSSLDTLDVSFNRLGALPVGVASLVSLHQLLAAGNRLSSLPTDDLSTLAGLQHVSLSHNRFADVPPALGTLPSLVHLSMVHNDVAAMERPVPSLQTLLLDFNQLEGLPDAVLRCPRLTVLSLRHNRLSLLPPNIGKLRRLRTLNLDGNAQLPELPDDIGKLAELRHLDLNATKMRRLPSGISRMRSLSMIGLKDTSLDEMLLNAYRTDGIEGVQKYVGDANRLSVA